MTRKRDRRQKDMAERLGQGGGRPAQGPPPAMTPQAVAAALQHLSTLAFTIDDLFELRLPLERVLDELLRWERPAGTPIEQSDALRETLVPRVLEPGLPERCLRALQRAGKKAPDRGSALAIAAGAALASSCVREQGRVDHPFWRVLFDLSLTDLVLSGAFIYRLVLDSLDPEGQAAAALPRAAAQSDAARELETLGVDLSDVPRLQATYAYLTQTPDSYAFMFDGALHLAMLQQEVAARLGPGLLQRGPGRAERELLLRRYEQAFRADVTQPLVDEYTDLLRRRLIHLRDDPEGAGVKDPQALDGERRLHGTTILALKAIPREECALLRAMHLRALVRARVAAPRTELAHVERLATEPTDTYALEDYESLLFQTGQVERGKRLKWFRQEGRKLAAEWTAEDEALLAAEQAAAPPPAAEGDAPGGDVPG